jgi:hypothetical protein
MSFFQKIKDWFKKETNIKEYSNTQELVKDLKNGEIKEGESVVLDERKQLDKFDAEFHNPRLECFYCKQTIESGRVRFFKAPGQTEESAFHKRCFKKLKEGKLPQ